MKKIIVMMVLMCSVVFADKWSPVNIVDEFGDTTGEVAITRDFTNGTFSNSATSDSKLDGFIKVGSDYVSFNTYEYGYSRGVASDMDDVTVKMKNSKGEIFSIELSSLYAFDNPQYNKYRAKKVKDFLKKSVGNIRVVIYGGYSTTQKFTINANGFTKALRNIKAEPKK